MQDLWESGNPYEYFMGRWSLLVSQAFVNWLSAPAAKAWLDIGCGTGALSEAILSSQNPCKLIALDQSEGFVQTAQKRLGSAAECKVGNAMDLPFADAEFDYVVSALLLNFLPEPETALKEMKRVTAPGGRVAFFVWDYSGKMEMLQYFWDAAVALNPSAAKLHESTRFPRATKAGLQQLLDEVGFTHSLIEPLEIETRFSDFDDYWKPFLGGQGPAPTYALSLEAAEREKLRDALYAQLPVNADGSLALRARAWAVQSRV